MALRRRERLADLIRSEVSRIILFEMKDPRMGFVTVTGVDVSSDMHIAKVRISVLGDEKVQAVTMHVIQSARGHIQKELGGKVRARSIPAITFELDESVKKSVHLLKTLRDVSGK